jgi:hypothetical protein
MSPFVIAIGGKADILDFLAVLFRSGRKNKNQFMPDKPNSRYDEALFCRYSTGGCVWVTRFFSGIASARAARACGGIFARALGSDLG